MTVKQLMNKLSKMPEDATVVMLNREVFEDGLYKCTKIDFDEKENEVEICTDYRYRKGDTGEWKE